jgi:dienelactone hydrolase
MGRARTVVAVAAAMAVSAVVGGAALGSAYGVHGSPAGHGGRAGHPSRGVVIQDVKLRVPGQSRRVAAYVVKPAGRQARHADAGILFLHWLGDPYNDRTEYLAEATGLAEHGVISVLPQGYFPWVPNPDGTHHDVTLVNQQVAAMHQALRTLIHTRGVDPKRIAIVGHDYGAMYGSLLADRDHRVSVLVLETPDSLMGNWFATYWLGLEGQARDDYLAMFDGLDPVDHTSRLGSHVLFQWAGDDIYIPSEVRDAFAAASPEAQVELYDGADHQLTDAATVDRDAFLTQQLGLH